MARRRDYSIEVNGLADLRRDLRAIDKGLAKELNDHVRGVVREVRDDARQNLHDRSKNPQNRIEKTIKGSLTAKGGSIYSDHPGSAVQNYGGTIAPRGTPIEIRGKSYMDDAITDHTQHVEDELARTLDVLAASHGFK